MPRLSLDRLGQASLLSALPVRIPGCVLWLDAGSLRLTSGDAVGTWTDLSGSGNHATQATAGNKPKYLEAADFLTSTEYGTLEFTAPDLITRTVGSWVTDGYNSAGRTLTVSGAATAANNGKFTIESATATVLTIAELTLANEAASTTETVKTNILNGRPVVRFDGEDDYLDSGNLGTSQPLDIYLVGKHGPPSTTWRYFCDGTTAPTRLLVGVLATTTKFGMYAGEPVEGGVYNQNYNVFGALFNGAASKLVLNGETVASGNAGSNSAAVLRFGVNIELGGQLSGDIAEVLVYNRNLSDAMRKRLERYLSRKYAITVS